ncbi:MAG: shikimate kinase [Fimbriimonadaceae bacterium]|nr:shikimate kinase [Alphaproteobacteria bacterium]
MSIRLGKYTIADRLDKQSIVLVGMMGAGKTTVGRRLATRLNLPFVDVDSEIEEAAGLKIEDIFSSYGEAQFRTGEQRVIERLLRDTPGVLATGGGAFMNPTTRKAISANGISVWLKADFDTLFSRVKRRNHRPLLKAENPEQILRKLIEERTPVYAQADITIESRDVPHDIIVNEITEAVDAWLN